MKNSKKKEFTRKNKWINVVLQSQIRKSRMKKKAQKGSFNSMSDRKERNVPVSRGKKTSTEDKGCRLNKFIANAGICSRRDADEHIRAGLVTVNGNVITEMGFRIFPGDDVRYNGERLKGEAKVYLLLNKPKNYVTTVEDPHADKTVMELVDSACPQRIYPVGRLDRNTTGLLLFTNDGDLTRKLTHPKFNQKKVYHVFLNKVVTKSDLEKLIEGVSLDGYIASADAVSYVGTDRTEVGLEIHSGENRVVRRMFEALGYKVKKLDRVFFAGLTKKNIPRGKWRFLTQKEVGMLKMAVGTEKSNI